VSAAAAKAIAGTVGDALGAATAALTAAGVDSPRLDAELLLADALGCDRAALAADPEAPVPAAAARSFGACVRRRVRREPLAYVLGRKGFRRLELRSDPRALVPRPETELLVELATELEPERVLDVGTGSGAIALAVADELPGASIYATDVSAEALTLARENAAALGLANRVFLEHGSLPSDPGPWDLVVANLPYVRDDEWAGLAPEISGHEPRGALLSGGDGLDAIRALIEACAPLGSDSARVPTAALALEVGAGQAEEVGKLVERAGGRAELRRDLAGIERVVLGRAPGLRP
jgi:release factor glutamine methyltransferase